MHIFVVVVVLMGPLRGQREPIGFTQSIYLRGLDGMGRECSLLFVGKPLSGKWVSYATKSYSRILRMDGRLDIGPLSSGWWHGAPNLLFYDIYQREPDGT